MSGFRIPERCIITASCPSGSLFMKIYLKVLILIILAFSLPGCTVTPGKQDGHGIPDHIRIGTYNVKNLFDGVDDPHKADDEPPSRERLAALSEVILAAGCDILALQEVENIDVLTDFNERYLAEYYSSIVLIEGNDPRGIDVAFMSKFPLLEVTSYADREIPNPETGRSIRFSRDLVAVAWIAPNGRKWVFLTTHLKSGRMNEDRQVRNLQVGEICRIIDEENFVSGMGNGCTVLLGDLNAEPWSHEMRGLAWVPFSDPARDLRYRFTHASGMILDYILLSPGADNHLVIGSYTIYRDSPADQASDHFLVYLDLKFR